MKSYYRVWFIYFLVVIFTTIIIIGRKYFSVIEFPIGCLFYYLILDNLFKLAHRNIFNNNYISPQNKILFHKLKKQYLNNASSDDIEQLLIFLDDTLQERNFKNERN